MTAQRIDGKALSRELRLEVASRAARLTAQGHRPGLAVILVGEDPASQVYVRGRHAVIIGRSKTVGKPLALPLLQANATVTICHSANRGADGKLGGDIKFAAVSKSPGTSPPCPAVSDR